MAMSDEKRGSVNKNYFRKGHFRYNKKQNFHTCADLGERRYLQRKKISDTYEYKSFRGQGYQERKHSDFKQQSVEEPVSVNNETYGYFERVSEKLKIGFESDEAKAVFIANVIEQAEDKGVELSCNRIISHTLQILLEACEDSIILMKFAKSFSSSLRQVCTNQYGSHVIESLLSSGMKILKKYAENNSDCQEEKKESSDSSLNIISWVLKFGKFCLNNVKYFLGHIYASHVLRALVEVWSGVKLEESVRKSKRSINQRKKFQNSKENSISTQSKEVAEIFEVDVPEEFVSQLKEFYRKIIESNNLIDCCIDTKISPILQTLLIGLQKRSPKHCQKFIKLLMKSAVTQNEEEEIPIAFTDKSGSCVIEKAILTADEKRQVWLWKHCFKNIIKSLVLHPIANFIVQKLFAALKGKEQFEEIFNEVIPYFEEILIAGHNGVIISIAEACVRLGTCQPLFMKVIMKVLQCLEPEQRQLYLSPLVIQLSTYTTFEKREKISENSVLLKDIPLSYHGSILLQHMLHFHKPVKVVKSVLFMKDDLKLIACDTKGSYVLESFLTAAHVGEKNREKLVFSLKPHLVSLACDKVGSHVLDSIWTTASLKQRTLISQELSSNESQLADNIYGRYINKKCGLFYFKRRNSDWKQVQNAETKKRKIFNDIIS